MANKQFKVPINLVNLASDPGTASEGDIYYNTTSDVVRVYANGAWASVGSGGGGSTSLDGVTDVTITSVADNEVLAYDTTTSQWINQTAVEAGISESSHNHTLDSLSNVVISGVLADKHSIVYDTETNKWVNESVFPSQTSNDGKFLKTNGSSVEWEDISLTYLTQLNASNTYLSITTASGTYLTQANASSTYAPLVSPSFTTPSLGAATATSINSTTIPTSKTLLITDNIGTSVQGYSSTLSGINTLGSGTGFLKNTAGTWSYDNSTYLTTSDASSTYLTQSNASSTYLTQSNAAASYQPLDADLTAIAAISTNGILTRTGTTTWAIITNNSANWDTAYTDRNKWDGGATGLDATTAKTSLGLVIGTDVQAYDPELAALAGLTSAADRLPYFTGSGTASLTTFTTFGRSLIDDADNTAARTTLGLGTMAIETAANYALLSGATFTGNIAINNGASTAITTTGTTAAVFNSNATTLNIGGAATAISIGSTAHTGTTTINNDLAVYGSITFSQGASSLSATTIQIDDTMISLADNNTADILDIGFYAGYRVSAVDYHTGLVRDASDSGKWKLFAGVTAQPTGTVDFTSATYGTLKIGALEVTDASTTRTNLGATTIGSNLFTLTNPSAVSFPKYNADNTVVAESAATYKTSLSLNNVENTALSTWAGSTNITTLGAVSATSINSTPIGATTASTGRFTSVNIDGKVLIDTFTGTGNAAAQNIDTAIDETIYTGAEYLVSVKTSTGRYLSKVLLICDGTNAVTITEYGILTIGTAPAVTVAAGGSIIAPQLSVNAPTSSNITLVRTLVAF